MVLKKLREVCPAEIPSVKIARPPEIARMGKKEMSIKEDEKPRKTEEEKIVSEYLDEFPSMLESLNHPEVLTEMPEGNGMPRRSFLGKYLFSQNLPTVPTVGRDSNRRGMGCPGDPSTF
ncbi:hypothetical protein SLEP1_g40733 [Rubroshorea leprosula]|uniref:Uncharacterized protein n=1 Tax=Rubroshorea leprosula TaxID=152421 RepID=A0AAV5L4H7_9ROSI|nr:hypothetical protein SLEP1_g40733 [Rubroshorea leprosula]